MISIWGLILAAVCYVIAESHLEHRAARGRHELEEALQREQEERAGLRSLERRS
jgi:hypothetical protein